MANEKENKIRVNIVMSSELLEKVDNYANEMCISRSSAISVLCSLQLKYEENISTAKEIMAALNNPAILEQLNQKNI